MLRLISGVIIFFGFFVYSFADATPFRVALAAVAFAGVALGEALND